jgi:succinoglycan biosynthesis transport protein ExoP
MTAPPSPREQMEQLFALVRRASAFWLRGLAVFVVCTAIAAPYIFTRPRSYRSETLILYQETMPDVAGGEGAEGARRVGGRLRELLYSRASLEPIIHDLGLYPESIIRGEDIEAVEELRKNIAFKAQGDGDTYDISFTGNDPKSVQAVTQRLGDCIIEEAAKRREDKAKTLKAFLTAESQRNEPDLRQKEADLTRFVVQHPEYATRLQGLPAPAPASTAGVTSSDPMLASLEARATSIERRLSANTAAPAPPSKATFQPPPDSADLVAARHALAEKLAMFTDKHPEVIAARSRLKTAEDAQAVVNAEALAAWQAQQTYDTTPPANPSEAAALKKELAGLQAQIAARRSPAIVGTPTATAPVPVANGEAPAPALELDFRRLQGDVNDARDRQQQLESWLFKASITASSVMDDRNIQVSVLDPAYLPVRPISKPRSLFFMAALAVSLLLGIATAFASALLDDRIHDRHDVERADILPVIAIIPKPGESVRRLSSGADQAQGR